MIRIVFVAAFYLIAALLAKAQDSQSTSEVASSSYFLRLLRAHDTQAACVLLRGDGQYHLERHKGERAKIFEGPLDPNELQIIISIVSNDQLLRLDQTQIMDPMVRSDEDQVELTIYRPGRPQELIFPDSNSRAPYLEFLAPLLRWLEGLPESRVPELSEEAARNNCLPPKKLELAQRKPDPSRVPVGNANSAGTTDSGGTTTANSGEVPTDRKYVLRMVDTQLGYGKIEMTCLIVLSSGAYHLVTQSRYFEGKHVRSAVLDGSLGSARLTSLREILDNPVVRKEPESQSPSVRFGNPFWGRDKAFVTQISIPRDRKVQTFTAWTSVPEYGTPAPHALEEHGRKLLKPLRDWLVESNVNAARAAPSENPANAKCKPGG